MKSTRRFAALLLSLVMAAVLVIAPVPSVFADDEDVNEPVLTVGGQVIIEGVYNDETDETVYVYHTDRLPAGVSFNQNTSTLTLTNATISSSKEVYYDKSYIYSTLEKLNVSLRGKNKFAGGAANYGINAARYDSELYITGATADASLTIDLSDTSSHKTGLFAARNMLIKDCDVSIIGGNTSKGFFYGASMNPQANYCYGEVPAEGLRMKIENANMRISSTLPETSNAYNAGLDSQDSHMDIINSNIDMNLTGGICLGIGCGLYYDDIYDYDDDYDDDAYGDDDDEDDDGDYYGMNGPVYGGQLSIDSKSTVLIKSSKPFPVAYENDEILTLYYYNNTQEFAEKIKSPTIYSYNPFNRKYGTGSAPLRKHTWINERFDCPGQYLEFSPYKISLAKTSYTYTGSAIKPAATVIDASGKTVSSSVAYSANKNAGIGVAKITAAGKTFHRYFTIAKAKQSMSVKGKTVSLKAANVRKKNQTISAKKAVTVKNSQGRVTYKRLSGNKKIKVASNGKITVGKGLKKGTYKVKIQVKAAGNKNYKSRTKNVYVKIRVR